MIGFTVQECGVAACVLEGMGDRQAAAALGMSQSLVSKHVRRMRERFHAKDRISLALALDRVWRPKGIVA